MFQGICNGCHLQDTRFPNESHITLEYGSCPNSDASMCHCRAVGGSTAMSGVNIYSNKCSVQGLRAVLVGVTRGDDPSICSAAPLCSASYLSCT